MDKQVAQDLAGALRWLVDRPEDLRLAIVPMRRATVFEVGTAPDDLGKVIGRQGRTARALRTLLDARGDADGAQYGLDLLDQ